MCVGSLFRVGLVALVINMGEEIKSGSVKKKNPKCPLDNKVVLKWKDKQQTISGFAYHLGRATASLPPCWSLWLLQ